MTLISWLYVKEGSLKPYNSYQMNNQKRMMVFGCLDSLRIRIELAFIVFRKVSIYISYWVLVGFSSVTTGGTGKPI